MDNSGRFPKKLNELVPDYLDPDDAKELLFFRSWTTQKEMPWGYAAGLSEKSPSNWILLWSPEVIPANGKMGTIGGVDRRLCIHCDGTGRIISEEEFRAQLKLQQRERDLEEVAAGTK
jgi:hypothetical protein